MSNDASKRLMIVGGAALLLALMPGAQAMGKQSTPGPRMVSAKPIMTMGVGAAVVPGGSILVRTRDGVLATIHASGLAEGTAVTAWFAIFQNPEFCATDPCTAADITNPAVEGSILNIGGRLIGADGSATVGGFRAVGDSSGSGGPREPPTWDCRGPSRRRYTSRSVPTGPASGDPAVLSAQLSTFNGGCLPNACSNVLVSIHQP